MQTDYLIIGASHAALSALQTLRMHDAAGAVTMVTRDASLPYSPTVLPYVVSGRSQPERVFLRDDDYFREQKVDYRRGAAVEKVDPERSDRAPGRRRGNRRTASSSSPAARGRSCRRFRGSTAVPFHVLRTLDDAIALRAGAAGNAPRASCSGAGLIGMHAAENLAKAGRERHDRRDAAARAAGLLRRRGRGDHRAGLCRGGRALHDGNAGRARRTRSARLPRSRSPTARRSTATCWWWASASAPVTDFLAGSGVELDRGVLVDDTMRSSVANIWAAGDVAQARGFYDGAQDAERHPARRGRAGPHRRHGDGRRPGRQDLSGRRSAQHLHVLRQAGGVGRRARRRRRRASRSSRRSTPTRVATSRSCSPTTGSSASSASTLPSIRA